MKKWVIGLGLLAVSHFALAAEPTLTTAPVDQNKIKLAQEGCQKSLGFLPTPSKLMCLLTALGIDHTEAKPKALALIFNVCHGRTVAPQPTGTALKAYDSLGACLKDPAAVSIINNELTSQGFTPVKVVNPTVLATPTTAKSL